MLNTTLQSTHAGGIVFLILIQKVFMARPKTSGKKKTGKTDQRDNIYRDDAEAPQSTNADDTKESTSTRMNRERLGSDEDEFIMMPEVSDIPGQESVLSAGVPGEMADSTAAADDEEGERDGKDVLEEEDDLEIVMGTEADVTPEDIELLGDPDQDLDMGEDELVSGEGLDDTDFEGDPLNEAAVDIETTGEDLDIPDSNGSLPRRDALDQGDEENDYYSLGDDRFDADDDGTPEEYRERETD